MTKLLNVRLVIMPVSDKGYPNGAPFTCEINPSSISLDYKIVYATTDAQGKVIDNMRFSKIPSPELSFEFTIDGTGTASPTSGTPMDVEAQVELFKYACYYYGEDIHSPKNVMITWWGPLISYKKKAFNGVLDTFSLTYTLFSPSGLPLRAKIKVKFVGSMNDLTESLMAKKSSPDLTHIKTINEGTSLSALCKEIYGDESFILEVARLNNLVSFRNIKPGSKLIFPPIK
jgi:hypothetical protein